MDSLIAGRQLVRRRARASNLIHGREDGLLGEEGQGRARLGALEVVLAAPRGLEGLLDMRRHMLHVAVGVQPVEEVRRHARRGARGSRRRGPTTSVERAGEAGSGPGFTHGQVATRPVASERQQ